MSKIKNILAKIGFWLFTIILAPFFLLWQLLSVVWSGVWALVVSFFVIGLFGGTIEEALAGASVVAIFVTVVVHVIKDMIKNPNDYK
jgi:hypothetical protein